MIKPTYFSSSIAANNNKLSHESLDGQLPAQKIIATASALIVGGLIGLSVLGFQIFNDTKKGS